jgi:hypothetical protein
MSGLDAGAQYRCDRCGRDLSGMNLRIPCVCGAVARRRVDSIGAMYRRPLAAQSPPWDPFKDWSVKYLQFTWNVVQLRRLYARRSGADAAEVRGIVEATFATCAQLADWLSSGPEPVTVTPGQVAQLIRTEPLSVCIALTAADDAAATSRIVTGTLGGDLRFWVEYRRPGARPTRHDALDLAEQCLRSWRRFLIERDVTLPSWESSS